MSFIHQHYCYGESLSRKEKQNIAIGTLSAIITFPFARLKTTLQTQTLFPILTPNGKPLGMINNLVQIIKKEGVLSLWKGASIPLFTFYICSNLNLNMIKVYCEDTNGSFISSRLNQYDLDFGDDIFNLPESQRVQKPTEDDYSFAGAVAILQSLIFAAVYNPVITIYTNRIAFQAQGLFSNNLEVVKAIYQNRGILGFFKGYFWSAFLGSMFKIYEYQSNLSKLDLKLEYHEYVRELQEKLQIEFTVEYDQEKSQKEQEEDYQTILQFDDYHKQSKSYSYSYYNDFLNTFGFYLVIGSVVDNLITRKMVLDINLDESIAAGNKQQTQGYLKDFLHILKNRGVTHLGRGGFTGYLGIMCLSLSAACLELNDLYN